MALKVGRPTDSRNFSDIEKNMIIETIKEYSLFNMQDKEIREIASRRLGRNISEDSFSRVKKQAQKQNMIASDWLDIFCRSQVIDYYWQRN